MNPSCKWSLTGIEGGPWTVQSGPSINPTPPTVFDAKNLPGEVIIFCAGPKYAGALAKQSNKLPWQSSHIVATLGIKPDDSIAFGQVIETDTKITDAAGWTYDGSFQLNVSAGWMAQIGNPWKDTGVKIPLVLDQVNTLTIEYAIDYVAHTLTVTAINGQAVTLDPIPGKQLGWATSQIITQLQLCTNGQAGEYTVRFQAIGYQGDN